MELMLVLAVVATLEYELAVVLQLLSLFVSLVVHSCPSPHHSPQKSWTSCRWIVELMPELAVVATLECKLAVVLELLSLFVSRRA